MGWQSVRLTFNNGNTYDVIVENSEIINWEEVNDVKFPDPETIVKAEVKEARR